MATLHQLNAQHKLANCLKLLATNDSLVLIESAVVLACQDNFLSQLPQKVSVFALTSDLQARGLAQSCSAAIQPLTDSEWVKASMEADRVCSW